MLLRPIVNCRFGKKLEVICLFGSSNSNDRRNMSPIEEGKEYDVKIEDTGRDGDGIARIEGFVVFVSGAKVGDEVKIRINSTRRNFAFAEVVE